MLGFAPGSAASSNRLSGKWRGTISKKIDAIATETSPPGVLIKNHRVCREAGPARQLYEKQEAAQYYRIPANTGPGLPIGNVDARLPQAGGAYRLDSAGGKLPECFRTPPAR